MPMWCILCDCGGVDVRCDGGAGGGPWARPRDGEGGEDACGEAVHPPGACYCCCGGGNKDAVVRLLACLFVYI